MAYSRLIRNLVNIPIAGAGTSTATIPVGVRGAILLELQLIWRARSFYNPNTSSEVAKSGDILVIVQDSAGRFVLYQSDSANYIVVPTESSWTWTNAFRNEFITAASYVGKLGASSLDPQPIGMVPTNNLLVTAVMDPSTTANHDLVVIAEFLSFDLSSA